MKREDRDKTHPSFSSIISSRCRFNLLQLNPHSPTCPSVLLKYALPLFLPGSTYQLPHRSFATRGRPPRDAAAEETKEASERMERRRLCGERLCFLRVVRRVFRVGWEGRTRSEREGGSILRVRV